MLLPRNKPSLNLVLIKSHSAQLSSSPLRSPPAQGSARPCQRSAVPCVWVGRDGWTEGHAHREGGLGHLTAVVSNAPAEAAGDASDMVLLLAAHHRLHGVAAHTDGSLRPEGRGDSGSSPPCGADEPPHQPPGPAWSSPRAGAHHHHPPVTAAAIALCSPRTSPTAMTR